MLQKVMKNILLTHFIFKLSTIYAYKQLLQNIKTIYIAQCTLQKYI